MYIINKCIGDFSEDVYEENPTNIYIEIHDPKNICTIKNEKENEKEEPVKEEPVKKISIERFFEEFSIKEPNVKKSFETIFKEFVKYKLAGMVLEDESEDEPEKDNSDKDNSDKDNSEKDDFEKDFDSDNYSIFDSTTDEEDIINSTDIHMS
jgi:hypothetical protein